MNASMKVYSLQNKWNNKEMSLLEIVERWKIGDCGKQAVIFNSDYIYVIESSLHPFAFFLVYFSRLCISSELHFSYIPRVVVSSLYHPLLPAHKPPPWVFWNFPLGFLFKVRFCKKSCIVSKFLDAREFLFLALLIIFNLR